MRDIFVMRDVAREIDARNRVVEPDPTWLSDVTTRPMTAIERAAAWPSIDIDKLSAAWGPRGAVATAPSDGSIAHCIRGCGSRLTIADGGFVCRQCMLAYGGQDS